MGKHVAPRRRPTLPRPDLTDAVRAAAPFVAVAAVIAAPPAAHADSRPGTTVTTTPPNTNRTPTTTLPNTNRTPTTTPPSAPPPPAPAPAPSPGGCYQPLLGIGSRGDIVASVQRRVGAYADKIYGRHTAAAVAAFQRAHGLVADGVVGPHTWAVLGCL